MKLDDPKSGRQVSFEQQYPTEEACKRAAEEFDSKHLGARRYKLKNGFSFKDGTDGDLERRFTYPGSAYLVYYEAMEDKKPVKKFGRLIQLYNSYIANGYRGIRCPEQDGGRDGRGGKTARCLLQADKAIRGEEFGLLINPPFPHGSPVSNSNKHHGRGGKQRQTKGYLLVLAGLVAGLAFAPLRKALRRRLDQPGR